MKLNESRLKIETIKNDINYGVFAKVMALQNVENYDYFNILISKVIQLNSLYYAQVSKFEGIVKG